MHDSGERLQQLRLLQAGMTGQVLQHCQRSFDHIRHVALQPRHGQLLHYHRNRRHPADALRPLVSIAAVDQARHELIYDGWVILCKQNC